MMAKEHRGKIVRIEGDGTGFVKDSEADKAYIFTFGKIPGYRGESIREIARRGIKVGASVTVVTTASEKDDAHVTSMRLA